MQKLTCKEIVGLLEEADVAVADWAEEGIDVLDPEDHADIIEKLGKVEYITQEGGEGQGDEWYCVNYFVDHDVYLRTDGFYASYSGTEFYDGFGSEVRPQERTITVYEGTA